MKMKPTVSSHRLTMLALLKRILNEQDPQENTMHCNNKPLK